MSNEQRQLRAHLLMMLEAMQYTGKTRDKDNDALRELVEDQKIVFIRKMQAQMEAENEHQ